MIAAETEDVVFQEEPRRYLYKGKAYRSVTERIKDARFGTDWSFVNPNVLEYARQRGNAVDTALVYHYEGDLNPDSVDPVVRGYFGGALKFDRECPGKIVAVHPRLVNVSMNVAGTPDLVRFVRGTRSMLDWKTGVDNPLQTWLYMMMWNLSHPSQPCYARYGLRLKANGDYVLKEHNDPDDGPAAMAIVKGDLDEIERWRPKYGYKINHGEN